MEIKRNVPLKGLTTFKIGGSADFFCNAYSRQDIVEATLFAKEKKLPIFILGGGSNVLLSDKNFAGLVIHINIKSLRFKDEDDREVQVVAGAGESWDEFVATCVTKNLYGLENLSLIPGSVGASVIQNIGAYGVQVKDTLMSVEVFDMEQMKFITLSADECRLEYRNSMFKTLEGRKYIVVTVSFRLRRSAPLSTNYPDLALYFKTHEEVAPTLESVRSAIISIRKQKLPDTTIIGTAGSFFKNPVISEEEFVILKTRYPEIPSFPQDDSKIRIPAGFIIDVIGGWKGYREGDAGVYEKQALVLVNYSSATQEDVLKLAMRIEKDIYNKTGIILEREVCVM